MQCFASCNFLLEAPTTCWVASTLGGSVAVVIAIMC